MESCGEVVRISLTKFQALAKTYRLAGMQTTEQFLELRQAAEAVLEAVEVAKSDDHKSGICVYQLPGFGYPELYVARVMARISDSARARERPG
ncbi:MAG: hypothetical protein NTX98_02905 [Candidatus Doudnabacteria bacterium]|nr:hypothetical protein [Candidatus Doudnabacteria bacterium]